MLGVSLDEQVYVVIRNFEGEYLVSELGDRLREQPCHLVFDESQYGVSVLWTPHEMILTRTNRMCMTPVLLHPNPYFINTWLDS